MSMHIPSALYYQVHVSKQAEVLKGAKLLQSLGLNKGTSGNLSIRCGDGFLVTPSGLMPDQMSENNIVRMDMLGNSLTSGQPSSEWRFHRDIYLSRPEVEAVVHVHSLAASSFSCLRRDLPAFHYMIALAGGDNIRCTPYALFGTQLLSDFVVAALDNRKACLMANHGMISIGRNLEEALAIAVEVEMLCAQYMLASQIEEPALLDSLQMAEVLEKFKNYGRKFKEKE